MPQFPAAIHVRGQSSAQDIESMRESTLAFLMRFNRGAIALAMTLACPIARAEAPVEPQTAVTMPAAETAAATPLPTGDGRPDTATMNAFLDRLMAAESGGRDDARNPRSTAVGPFQFIESTFLDMARRHFAAETSSLLPAQILALRTNRVFARRAAEAFTRDNADILANNGQPATLGNLRLAFLVGPSAAVRLLRADPTMPVIAVLGANVVQANPFMAGMTARDLTAWSERSIAPGTQVAATITPRPAGLRAATLVSEPAVPKPVVVVPPCNTELASCRKWLALAQNRPQQRRVKVAAQAIVPRKAAAR